MRLSDGLNPRFDGAFLNWHFARLCEPRFGLNPRFDGAFLNFLNMNEEVEVKES